LLGHLVVLGFAVPVSDLLNQPVFGVLVEVGLQHSFDFTVLALQQIEAVISPPLFGLRKLF
jgi:hypothetical protein